jgi:hypothetical protein
MDDEDIKNATEYFIGLKGMTFCPDLIKGMVHTWLPNIVISEIFKPMSTEKYNTHNFYKSLVSTERCDHCIDCGIYCNADGYCIHNLSCDEFKIKDILE